MDVLSMLKHTIIADDVNPINSYYELGRQTGSAGPEMVWKIYEAVRKEDKRVKLNTSACLFSTCRFVCVFI